MVSLGALALTIDLTLFIMIAVIVLVQGLDRVMRLLFPLTNLLFVVFAIAILIVGLYFNQHTYYTSSLPVWVATYALYFLAAGVAALGAIGYISDKNRQFAGMIGYILALTLSAFLSLVTGLAMLLRTSTIREQVSKEWPSIAIRLKEAGYEDVSESMFSQFLEVNLKFAGLFIIVFCFFLIMGLLPAIYKSISIKRERQNSSGILPNVVLGGLIGATES